MLGINQDFSKTYVRITIKIPQMRTGLNWKNFTREAKNGAITKATYHGTYVIIIIYFSIIYYSNLYLDDFIFSSYSIKVNQQK